MRTCIFCKIAKGEFDSAKVYEDEDVFAFLDINPVSKGHCLVISKKHFENIFDINPETFKKIVVVAKDISEKIKKTLGADGLNLLQSNGTEAGQVIFHFHLHIIPRYKDDGLRRNQLFGERPKTESVEELRKIAEEINKN